MKNIKFNNLYHDTLKKINRKLFEFFDFIACCFYRNENYHHCCHKMTKEEVDKIMKDFDNMMKDFDNMMKDFDNMFDAIEEKYKKNP